MERPTILLAVAEGGEAYVDALRRAGFEPISVEPSHVTDVPHVDMGVIDCDLPPEVVTAVYQQLQAAEGECHAPDARSRRPSFPRASAATATRSR